MTRVGREFLDRAWYINTGIPSEIHVLSLGDQDVFSEDDVAQMLGVNRHTLRGWRKNRFINPGQGERRGDTVWYNHHDIVRAALVTALRSPEILGDKPLSFDEIRDALTEPEWMSANTDLINQVLDAIPPL